MANCPTSMMTRQPIAARIVSIEVKIAIASLALTLVSFSQAQDKVIVPRKDPVAGQHLMYSLELTFLVMQQEATFKGTAHQKVIKVEPDGSYEGESWLEKGVLHIMGSDQEQPEEHKVSKHLKGGQPVDKKEFESGIDELLSAFSSSRVPESGAKVGDKWEVQDWFGRLGKCEATFLGLLKVGGKECASIMVAYSPIEGGSAEGKVYWGLESGDLVALDVRFSKVAIAQGIESDGTAKLTLIQK